MTFKGFVSAILEKIVCKHDWELLYKIAHYFEDSDEYPMYYIFHYKCKKCGKFKKIKS